MDGRLNWDRLAGLLERVDGLTWGVVAVNLVLILFARHLVRLASGHDTPPALLRLRVHVFQSLNLAIVLGFVYWHFFSGDAQGHWARTALGILVLIYLAYLVAHLLGIWILRRFGKRKQIRGEWRWVETYQSRLLTLVSRLLVFVVTLITLVRMLGFESLLEAGGVLGFIGVLLAMTQATWAPDLFSGLILLNSNVLEEGDVLRIGGEDGFLGVVFKTKMFHTEILDLVANHRLLVRNAALRDRVIHNLSKFASARGVRDRLAFNIGYDVCPAQVRAMLEDAWSQVVEDQAEGVEIQFPLETGLENTGDHALEWGLFYYTKTPERIPAIRRTLNEYVLEAANRHGISLATPLTHEVRLQGKDVAPELGPDRRAG
ncbi:small conductance mechanosensitive channel [Methylomarinovum caldicuralii]|uniref:Small-conductance mechanosensitive channel n=1 Tax=Methylomarinovum caldicuralii TaxID=438856 RepID=A0AAU9BX26_9GAMM|nr:mechanosensitive ion channel family protein [Methylomarinovum caldicuralii]BCX80770.1 small conductance mechanosensitive channel [Methylomarinovum caldicuralii]